MGVIEFSLRNFLSSAREKETQLGNPLSSVPFDWIVFQHVKHEALLNFSLAISICQNPVFVLTSKLLSLIMASKDVYEEVK